MPLIRKPVKHFIPFQTLFTPSLSLRFYATHQDVNALVTNNHSSACSLNCAPVEPKGSVALPLSCFTLLRLPFKSYDRPYLFQTLSLLRFSFKMWERNATSRLLRKLYAAPSVSPSVWSESSKVYHFAITRNMKTYPRKAWTALHTCAFDLSVTMETKGERLFVPTFYPTP